MYLYCMIKITIWYKCVDSVNLHWVCRRNAMNHHVCGGGPSQARANGRLLLLYAGSPKQPWNA